MNEPSERIHDKGSACFLCGRVEELLSFYMGKNTPDRQEFIIDNLKVELDLIEA